MTERAIFAAGCFWGVEADFQKVEGVVGTRVGYTGGTLENPDYAAVCRGDSGHAEAVAVDFDPERVSYSQLLQHFWKLHDPTQVDRQGADVGSQYRSAIFYLNEEQRRQAEESKRDEQHRLPIATEITPASDFWEAEDYHQCYVQKRRGFF